jgi:DNA-binding NtrC family response regulator
MTSSRVDAPLGLVGQSPQIEEIRRQVERIRDSRAPVLLLGESGTGKEVVARALHNSNPRGAFIPIDCGALVGPLMESELFGHVKGAFTGAAENKRGLIDMANNGTAFFDEIGDLPLDMQVKLLRLLQEREFRPVGSLHRTKVDLRVIAATHRDLKKEVERGGFRLDLMYRLNVITLRLPPLRQRKDDIPLLVDRFLAKYGEFAVPPHLLDAFMRHDWPGNVRELQNCIDRMTALNRDGELHVDDLPSSVRNAPMNLDRNVGRVEFEPVIPLADVEKKAIQNAMRHTRGDRAVAAVLLGIGRTTLYRKLKEYNLELESDAGCDVQLRK